MTAIPADAERVVLAAVVPCEVAGDPYYCTGRDDDTPCRWKSCNGDGTRTVVTDIEVVRYKTDDGQAWGADPDRGWEPSEHADADAGDGCLVCAPLWREVNEHG